MRVLPWLFFCLICCCAPQMSWAQYVTNGSATATAGCFRLTSTNTTFQTGSVWYLNKVNIQDGFDLYFEVFLGCNNGGADGIAFVLQPISTSVGTPGEGLGYQGVTPSIAVEIDTWQNNNRADPVFDHISLQSNGVVDHFGANNLAGPVPALASGGNIEDCQNHNMRVYYRADSQLLRIYIDCDLRLSYTGDLVNNIFGGDPEVFWGFTGATGGFVNEQAFCLDYISFIEDLQDTAICSGESVQLFAGSGDSYLWSPATGLNNPTIAAPTATPLTTTTYVAQITDVCGQVRFDTVVVVVTDILPPFPPQTLILCNNGSLTIDATIPYGEVYDWNDGATGPIRTVSQPGTYQVTIQYPCSTITRDFVVNPSQLPTSSANAVSCFGQNDGSATVVATGMGPYSYQWTNAAGSVIRNTSNTNSSQDQANNLVAGTYQVRMTNGAGCRALLTVVITSPPLLAIQLPSQQDILCGGTATGAVTLSASGGTPPYQYRVGTTGPFQSSPNVGNLAAGTYLATVRDGNGCLATQTVVLTENPPLLAQLTNTQPVVCFGDSSGSATFNAIGGVPPYQYGLGNGAFQGSPTLSNLAAGTYLGIVEDNVGCRDTVSFTVGEPPALQLNVIAQRNVDCQGNATGALTVSGNGGVLPYDYAFDGGPFGADTSWSTLSAGTYVVQVRDANGCITPLSVSITEPSALMLQIDSLLMVDCYGNASGVAFLGGMGGSAPYEFALPGTGTPFGPSSVIDSLSQGTYLLVMRDDSSCLDTVAATITQPDSLSARVTNRVDVDCLGNNTGELSVAGTGGTLPFQYAINNGSFGSSPTFDSLFANFFTLTVRDDNGCLASVDTLITTPTGLTAGIDVLISVACNGDSTGSVLMAAQGGTAPYRYTYDGVTFTSNPFFGNLPAQTDTVTLIDVNECIVPIPYTITQPAPLNLSISEQADVACQGDSTGFVRLLASGGVQPYLFVLDNVQTFSDTLIDGLPAGPHLITMIDDSSCSVDLSFTISEPSPLVASIAVQKNIDCYDNRNGAVEVLANGGVGPYWVALDTMAFDTLFRFDSLPAGAYLITVQDDSACTTTLPVTITQPDSLTLDTLLTLDIACAGDTAGLISLLAQGGTRPYQFALDSGLYQLDSVFSGLAAGDYSLTVQDDSACLAQMSVRLREPSPLQLTLLEQQMVDCYGNANGRLAFSAQGGQPGYQFQLDQGPPVPDSVFAPLAPGFYRVTLLDANGCNQFQDSLQITQPDSLTLDLAATDVRCFGGQDGQIEALLAGGTAPFEINWNSTPPQMGLIAQNLSIGRYLAEVLDANGCSVSGSTELTQPPLLRLSLVNQTDAYCDRDNGSAQVAATGGTGAYQFAWSGGTGLRAAVAPNLFGGDYLVSVTDSSGCRDSLIVPIGNTPPPTARFRTEPSTDGSLLLSQAEVLFINESEGAVAYEWDFGASGAKSLAANPSYRYEEEGSYTIRLTAFNDYYLCPSSYELTLNVIFDGAVAVANAFTPNHDGVNDWFPIAHAGVVSGSWAVYNRWGREVRRYGSIEDRWDGLNMSGTPVPEGVYVYVLQARLNSGAEVTKSGTVTLIR